MFGRRKPQDRARRDAYVSGSSPVPDDVDYARIELQFSQDFARYRDEMAGAIRVKIELPPWSDSGHRVGRMALMRYFDAVQQPGNHHNPVERLLGRHADLYAVDEVISRDLVEDLMRLRRWVEAGSHPLLGPATRNQPLEKTQPYRALLAGNMMMSYFGLNRQAGATKTISDEADRILSQALSGIATRELDMRDWNDPPIAFLAFTNSLSVAAAIFGGWLHSVYRRALQPGVEPPESWLAP